MPNGPIDDCCGLTSREWDSLLRNLEHGDFVPFLGAGASAPALPLGGELAADLAKWGGYPFTDTTNLQRVCQYLSIDDGGFAIKNEVIDRIHKRAEDRVAAQQGNDTHALLADLPIKYFLTTNYDDLIYDAFVKSQKKPRFAFPKWNDALEALGYETPLEKDGKYYPSIDEPFIYHFHGRHDEWRSIVLNEDDYVEFLANLVSKKIIPDVVLKAIGYSSLVLIGYSLEDVTLRTIIAIKQTLVRFRGRGATVLVAPSNVAQGKEREARDYLKKRMGGMNLSVYWGDANSFVRELHEKWQQRG
ncbi:SIR2 family NAD-dependent protein deacylase [Ensifer adhaerens]|uniref:SIR2 family protein n=1 Tax=Ensifer adhaerens TaxID=106592 RepID=A0A9Q8YHC1_ENSAD|nr:SIR2 family protein [Ensifer adhaerens]USJ27559.1 SIR2 family protein [Ensifer adhaerens]